VFEMDMLLFVLLAGCWTFVMLGLGSTWGHASAEYDFEKRHKKTE